MLTITIDGKKYHWSDKSTEMDGAWLTNDTIKDLIRAGVLVEEVKENKEPDTSILEKLKDRIESKRLSAILDMGKTNDEAHRKYLEGKERGYEVAILEIDIILTSLENSSEIPNSSPISKMETTQFTPGQEEAKISMKVGEKTFEITIKSI